MSRRNVAFYLPSEGGTRLGGSNYEVRVYDGASKTGAVASTLYADDTTATTLTAPLKPNAGGQTVLTATANNGDGTVTVNDVSSFQLGDVIPIRNATTQIFRTVTAINAGTKVLTISQTITGGPFNTSDTVVGDPMMKGWVEYWVDDLRDYTVEFKNVATGKVGPRASLPLKAPASIPNVRAYHNADQAITTATFTALALNSERFDTDTIHDLVTNNSRLTCKTAGVYQITGHGVWEANATGDRVCRIRLNGATYIAAASEVNQGNTDLVEQTVTALYNLAVNDYVELVAWQNSGGNLNLKSLGNYSPEFEMVKVSD